MVLPTPGSLPSCLITRSPLLSHLPFHWGTCVPQLWIFLKALSWASISSHRYNCYFHAGDSPVRRYLAPGSLKLKQSYFATSLLDILDYVPKNNSSFLPHLLYFCQKHHYSPLLSGLPSGGIILSCQLSWPLSSHVILCLFVFAFDSSLCLKWLSYLYLLKCPPLPLRHS